MKRHTLAWIAFTALLLSLIGLGTTLSSDAAASPRLSAQPAAFQVPAPLTPFNDPHIPSYNNGWCPGGGLGTEGRAGWCDGVEYDDGSFWHQNGYQGVWGFKVSTTCALRTDNPFVLDKAPAGGCDGEA